MSVHTHFAVSKAFKTWDDMGMNRCVAESPGGSCTNLFTHSHTLHGTAMYAYIDPPNHPIVGTNGIHGESLGLTLLGYARLQRPWASVKGSDERRMMPSRSTSCRLLMNNLKITPSPPDFRGFQGCHQESYIKPRTVLPTAGDVGFHGIQLEDDGWVGTLGRDGGT